MCGILYAQNFAGNEPVNDKISDMYEHQSERGVEGFGIAMIRMRRAVGKDGELITKPADKPGISIFRSAGEASFLINLKTIINPASLILAHHRQPTSSPNRADQTHPILIRNGSLQYDYLLAHNGIIWNATKLREEHEKLGFLYSTANGKEFNDSESLGIELARYFEQQTGAEKLNTEGSVAFILMRLDKQTAQPIHLFFGRNESNPLRYGRNNNNLVIASENIGSEIEPHIVHILDLAKGPEDNWKIHKLPLIIPYYTTSAIGYDAARSGALLPGKSTTQPITQYDDDDYPVHSRTTAPNYSASDLSLYVPDLFPNVYGQNMTAQHERIQEDAQRIVDGLSESLIPNLENLVEYSLSYGQCEEAPDIIKEITKVLSDFVKEAQELAIEAAALKSIKDEINEPAKSKLEKENEEREQHYASIT